MREILKEQKRLLAAWLIAEFFCALLTVGMSLFMKQMSDTAYGTRGVQGVRELMLGKPIFHQNKGQVCHGTCPLLIFVANPNDLYPLLDQDDSP